MTVMRSGRVTIPLFLLCLAGLGLASAKWCVLSSGDLSLGAHHTRHAEVFGKYVKDFNNGINLAILRGIDIVQAHAMDGGGYFTGKDSVPTESPVYYNLHLFGRPLIEVPRHSSYCSGATYTAFIEALNLLLGERAGELSEERYEALRMQELDGGRREDHVKFWGHWNADGFGSHYALVQYGKMGEEVAPCDLRPGDFVNISWRSGLGHSVIFLGWAKVKGDKKMLYWSSQRATNGYGDQLVSLKRIKNIKGVRLTKPEGVFTFDPATPVDTTVAGQRIPW
ncbi:MAG: hypothetical protein ONB25_02290 [candidate division KSB1 bacterium]|nr:hypothetical protein [candidate division KSB1 bacterium]MDZ7414110.1 hypothetical protein [candidate division KSB1 bacterium]